MVCRMQRDRAKAEIIEILHDRHNLKDVSEEDAEAVLDVVDAYVDKVEEAAFALARKDGRTMPRLEHYEEARQKVMSWFLKEYGR